MNDIISCHLVLGVFDYNFVMGKDLCYYVKLYMETIVFLSCGGRGVAYMYITNIFVSGWL